LDAQLLGFTWASPGRVQNGGFITCRAADSQAYGARLYETLSRRPDKDSVRGRIDSNRRISAVRPGLAILGSLGGGRVDGLHHGFPSPVEGVASGEQEVEE
jgi:hypothetical protein